MMAALVVAACLPASGERLLAQDFGASWPEFAALGEVAAGYAPAPGARRVFGAPELARLAARHGIAPPAGGEICIERATARLTPEQVEAAMRKVFPEARLAIREVSRYPAPAGELVFPREGLRADGFWRGWVRHDGNRRFLVWARVEIKIPERRVRAVAALAAGRAVEPAQLAEERVEVFPARERLAAEAAQVAGRKPRRAIAEGAWIPLDALEDPHAVERGETVAVEVESGAARLRLAGRAETSGARGQTVRVRNPETRRTFTARVEDKGMVKVRAR